MGTHEKSSGDLTFIHVSWQMICPFICLVHFDFDIFFWSQGYSEKISFFFKFRGRRIFFGIFRPQNQNRKTRLKPNILLPEPDLNLKKEILLWKRRVKTQNSSIITRRKISQLPLSIFCIPQIHSPKLGCQEKLILLPLRSLGTVGLFTKKL